VFVKIRNQQTICIISTEGTQASSLIRSLAFHTNHRLLLMSDNSQWLQDLITEIRAARESAPVEIIQCMVDGSWEADIIILDIPHEQIAANQEKLAIVTNQKIIIHFSQPDTPSVINPGFNTMPTYNWTKWFPFSSLVRVFIGSLASIVESDDREAATTVLQILEDAGLNPFESEKYSQGQLTSFNITSQKQ
jgi:hypothetical protein